MKSITKFKEYELLKKLPGKIQKLELDLKQYNTNFTTALEDKEAAETALNEAYTRSDSHKITSKKAEIKRLESKIEKLKAAIDKANDELEESRKQLSESKAAFRSKVIPIVDDILKEFVPAIQQVEELNSTLKEIQGNTVFGVPGAKIRAVPSLPTIKFYQNGCGWKPTRILDNKIKSWNDAK